MLHRLLDLLRAGETHRITDLAQELGTTSQLVELMLEDLSRLGYVKRVSSTCSAECATCPMSGMCAAGSSLEDQSTGRVWVLTEKAS